MLLLATTMVSQAAAQASTLCAGYASATQSVCTAAIGSARLLAPALGVLVSGGDPAVGYHRGVGPFAGLGATLRANATQVVIPDLSYDGTGSTVAAKRTILAIAPLFEATIPVYDGGSRGALAVDLLGSAQLLPTGAVREAHLDLNALRIGSTAVGIGIGARITLIPEGSVVPGLSVSAMRRGIPRLGIGSVPAGDQYSFVDHVHAMNYRATLGKRVGLLMFGAGLGYDRYSGDASVDFMQPGVPSPQAPPDFAIADDRLLAYVDGGIRLGRLQLIGEAGCQRGSDLRLGLDFADNNPQDRRYFGSVGFRFGY